MLRTLIYAAAFSLTVTISAPVVCRSSITDLSRVPRIVGSVQFPQTRWRVVRHTIRLQIPQNSNALSQLNIKVPSGLTVSNKITISDQSGQKIDNTIAIYGNSIVMSFPKSVAPKTELKIAMKNIKIVGISNAWLYPVSAKFVGINADLPIGIAQFRIYR